jgi:NDP-sugar pyrophosphorylase family protein
MSAMLMEALVLAGGFGSRLKSLLPDAPKPMAEVAGKPFLEWLLLYARKQGVRRVVLCTGYRAEVIESYFGDGRALGLEIRYSLESSPLGTGGALRNALSLVREDCVLAFNADSYCRYSLADMLAAHARNRAAATMWLVPVEDCGRYGSVHVGKSGSVVSFSEKNAETGHGLINAGIYLLEKSLIAGIPEGRNVSLEREIFPTEVSRGLFAVAGRGPFIDIGTPESFARATEFMSAEQIH